MLPDPLHPAVVHVPLALAVLLPISALVALWTMRRGARALQAWVVPVALALLLTGSAWAALRTGEAEEDRVEAVVGHDVLHEHEEAAERFLLFSGLVTVVGMVGLVGGTVGAAGRLVATAGSVVVLVSAIQVGAAGGELVYRHGAASAYVEASATAGAADADAGEPACGGGEERAADDPATSIAETPADTASPDAASSGSSTAAAGTRMALPGLFTIMAGLEQDLYRISRGLWLADPDAIAAGADGVASHPEIPSGEAERIASVLGPEMQAFAALDREVHDLSVRIRELARQGEVDAVLPLDAAMRRGCAGCHSRFRETLRAAIR